MILGAKCEGCGMWTRITLGNPNLIRYLVDTRPIPHYYCDECEANVVHHTTKARITL